MDKFSRTLHIGKVHTAFVEKLKTGDGRLRVIYAFILYTAKEGTMENAWKTESIIRSVGRIRRYSNGRWRYGQWLMAATITERYRGGQLGFADVHYECNAKTSINTFANIRALRNESGGILRMKKGDRFECVCVCIMYVYIYYIIEDHFCVVHEQWKSTAMWRLQKGCCENAKPLAGRRSAVGWASVGLKKARLWFVSDVLMYDIMWICMSVAERICKYIFDYPEYDGKGGHGYSNS